MISGELSCPATGLISYGFVHCSKQLKGHIFIRRILATSSNRSLFFKAKSPGRNSVLHHPIFSKLHPGDTDENAGIALQIGHVLVGNFNIHIWACSGDFIVTKWGTGNFVIISEYNGTIKNAYDTT